MERLYDNLDEAKAFALSFTNFAYYYDDEARDDFWTVLCEKCGKAIQTRDYLCPRSSCKKPTSILHSLEFGVSPELRDDLIAQFDVTQEDFRPIRSKRGELVYYQITPQHVMLPLHEENEWPILQQCAECGCVLYDRPEKYNEKGEEFFLISQAALDDMHDFNITYESFRRHYPLFVISRRVYDYLTEHYPRTHYFPFFLKEPR